MKVRATYLALFVFWPFTLVNGQEPKVRPTLPRYPEIRTDFLGSLSDVSSDEERLELYRETVRRGRHAGDRRLARQLHNFSPDWFHLDPTKLGLRGLDKTVLRIASDSLAQVQGASRTILYANALAGSGIFEVSGINVPCRNPLGKTDADIVVVHRSTDLPIRIEVNEQTLKAQRADLARIMTQIDKMALDAQMTGEIPVLINRHEFLPEIKEHARKRGVWTYEKVRTGESRYGPGQVSFEDVVRDLDKKCQLVAAVRLAVHASYVGRSSWRFAEGAMRVHSWERLSLEERLAALHELAHGAGYALDSLSQALTKASKSSGGFARLASQVGKGARYFLPIAGYAGVEIYIFYEYYAGRLSNRQFWRVQARQAGWTTGVLVGLGVSYLIGGHIGVAVGLGVAWVSGYLLREVAELLVDSYYHRLDEAMRKKYVEFLIQHYGLHYLK
ncbi:MAG: hypothetical protein RMI91_08725 [Gemmatales bacterium]|nr:hypothetical protein [Gemmatales bacterium]MDW7994724.1 hypothetical protein [Gemmatales bacterium]MDW8175306.1 hypothetical protein [Gemmatales bacterium]